MKKIILTTILINMYLTASSQFLTGLPFSGNEDINPDVLMRYTITPYTHQVFAINLWDDPANDLEFVAHGAVSSGGSAAYINVTSLNANVYVRLKRLDSVFVPATSTWNITNVADPLGTGEEINTLDALWDNSAAYLTDHSASGGGVKDVNDWIGGEKFLALKYLAGSSVGYGWIRLECPDKDSCYVKDFSFSQPVIGINEISKNDLMIYPNPVTDNFYLWKSNTKGFNVSNFRIKDLQGREIKFTCGEKGEKIEIKFDGNLPDGCYVIEYFSNDDVFTKKLIKISE